MKIVMIGPVYPFKGGISHYTGLLCNNLRHRHEVKMLSYSMQYPKILFKKEQKDCKSDTFKVEGADFFINTANPFNWIRIASLINRDKPDLVIIQWWHPYFAPCYWGIIKLLKKTEILFICHNVFPHERFPMDKILVKNLLSRGDYYVLHSSSDLNDLLSMIPQAKYTKTALPSFGSFKKLNLSQKTARAILNIKQEERILLFFGLVKKYKGLCHLLNAMPNIITKINNCRLFVVGDFPENKKDYLEIIEKGSIKESVMIINKYVPDDEIELYFAACDIVVLPYESATQSGVIQIAYGFNKPVIATNVGGLVEVVLDDRTGYIVKPNNPGEIAKAVNRFFTENKREEFEKNIKEEAYKYSWDRMVEVVESIATDK